MNFFIPVDSFIGSFKSEEQRIDAIGILNDLEIDDSAMRTGNKKFAWFYPEGSGDIGKS